MATFIERYQSAVNTPTPRIAFMQRIMAVTGRSKDTVQSWALGRLRPSKKAREQIAEALGASVDELFPEKE